MKKRLLLLFVICCFTACTQKPQIGDAIFVNLDRPEKASLFDYFRSIELIPLETSSDALVAGISKMIIHQDRYYMLDPIQSIIFVFKKTGEFLNKIDKKGQGAGEYTFIQDFNINPFTGNLEVLEPYGAVYVYDLSGDFIEKKRITYPEFRAVHTLIALNNSLYVCQTDYQPQKIIYYNMDEQVLLHEEFEEDRDLAAFSFNPYQYQNDWFFFRPVHPVVYKIGKEQLEVAFQFDFGKYAQEGRTANFSKESERNFTKKIEEMFTQFSYMIQAVRHNNRYVFASLYWKDMDHKANIIYDKVTGKSKFILDFAENVVFNSYRGEEIIVTDEYALAISQWADLETRISREMLTNDQKEIFEELVQADMEQNPVLIKYWFK